jgi:hypothetical protein
MRKVEMHGIEMQEPKTKKVDMSERADFVKEKCEEKKHE